MHETPSPDAQHTRFAVLLDPFGVVYCVQQRGVHHCDPHTARVGGIEGKRLQVNTTPLQCIERSTKGAIRFEWQQC